MIHLRNYFVEPSKYEAFFGNTDKPLKNFVSHSDIRFCTLGKAASRCFENFSETKKFFTSLHNDKKQRFGSFDRKIKDYLDKPTMQIEILFVIEICQICEIFLTKVQTNELIIFTLYDKMCELIEYLLVKIYKPDKIQSAISDQYLDPQHILNVEKVKITTEIETIFRTEFDPKERKEKIKEFKTNYISSIEIIISYLFNKNILRQFYELLRYFKIDMIYSEDAPNQISKLAKMSKFPINYSAIHSEVIFLQIDKDIRLMSTQNSDLLLFYKSVFKIKKDDLPKYPELEKLFKICITISHGQAEIERGFNISSEIMDEKSARMEEDTFNNRK